MIEESRLTIANQINASVSVKQAILANEQLIDQIAKLATDCLEALKNGGKIIFAGNGGSFADAQHLSAELTVRYAFDRGSLPSIALGCNNSAISAIGNDYGYDQVFAREMSSIALANDVYIPITTSGNSTNILLSIPVAKARGVKVYALTGQSGGELKGLCECIQVPSNETGRIQESHIMIGHIICALVEQEYFNGES